MASCDIPKRCFLCLNTDCMKIQDSILFSKIGKYLEIKVCSSGPLQLCMTCIQAVESFHVFYERVKNVHQGNEEWGQGDSRLIKVEVLEDNITHWESNLPDVDSKANEDKSFADDTASDHTSESSSPVRKNFKLRESTLKQKSQLKGKSVKTKKTINAINKRNLSTDSEVLKKSPSVYTRFSTLIKDVGNLSCPICTEKTSCSTLDSLKKHFQELHPGEKSFIMCCDKKYMLEFKNRLRVHLMTHSNPESCRCDICGKTLATPKVMRIHREGHIPEAERQFACEICGKKFGGRRGLTSHRSDVHSGRGRYSMCQICGKEMKRICLQKHVKHVHEGVKKTYVCALCGKTYPYASSFHYHMENAHNDTPKTKQCPDCGKRFAAAYLKTHMKRFHSSRSGCECTICDRVFKLPGDLRAHMVTHTDERPFPCSFCGAAFKTKATFKTHMGQHTGVNPVKCPYCGKMISNRNNYITHRRRMHIKEHLESLKVKDSSLGTSQVAGEEENVKELVT